MQLAHVENVLLNRFFGRVRDKSLSDKRLIALLIKLSIKRLNELVLQGDNVKIPLHSQQVLSGESHIN